MCESCVHKCCYVIRWSFVLLSTMKLWGVTFCWNACIHIVDSPKGYAILLTSRELSLCFKLCSIDIKIFTLLGLKKVYLFIDTSPCGSFKLFSSDIKIFKCLGLNQFYLFANTSPRLCSYDGIYWFAYPFIHNNLLIKCSNNDECTCRLKIPFNII